MNGKDDTAPRDNKQIGIIVLAVVATIMAGLIIGFIASGGLSDEPAAAPPTTTAPATGGTAQPTVATPTTQPSVTEFEDQLHVLAIEDTYVNSGEPNEISGSEDVLEIENDPPENKQALIRFEVPAIPEGVTLSSVTLRLYVVADTDETVTIHEVGGPWAQADSSGASAPAVGAQVGMVPPGTAEGSSVDVDLTGVVTEPGTYDFYLTMASDDSAEFASIESGTNAPLLILFWGEGEIAPPEQPSSSTPSTQPAAQPATQLTGTPVVMAGAGDISDCDSEGDTATAALLDEVVAGDPSAIVYTTGDNVYSDGAPEEFAQCYGPTWGRHKDRTRPSPGNHDYNTPDATGYFGYFGEAAGNPGEGYYAFEAGEWQVLALNSNCGDVACDEGSAQVQWLRQQLESSDAACTLAYWHHPLFSSGSHGGDDSVAALFTALYEGGAEVVLNGHDHNYERFAPQDPTGTHDPVAGIRQFVVGTGGTGNRGVDGAVPNSESRYNDTFGVLKLSLYSNGYEWEYLAEPGSDFVDVGVGNCH